MATDRLINSTQGDSIIGKLDDIKTAINNQSTAATATPLMDGAAAVGTSTKYARENHVHPTDTSRAANVMSTYAIDTARENITTSSTVQSAIEQLEYREETNKNNILSLNQVSQYNMAGRYNSETGRASFAELYKLALDSLGLDASVLHHYIVLVYTNTVSPTADLLIMYGTYYYNNSISHAVLYNSQLSYYADNKQGTLLVSGGDDTIQASVRFLD